MPNFICRDARTDIILDFESHNFVDGSCTRCGVRNAPAPHRVFTQAQYKEAEACCICERRSFVIIISDHGPRPLCELCMARPSLVEAAQMLTAEDLAEYLAWVATQPEVFEPEQQPYIIGAEL